MSLESLEEFQAGNEAEVSDTVGSASKEEEIDTPFFVKTWKEDLTLIVENKKLYVNKAILAIVSPVFDKMFTDAFKERDSDELPLPEKKYTDVLEFLHCVYPGVDQKDITAANARIIAPLADEYQITKLLSTCDSVLASSLHHSTTTSDIYKDLKFATRLRLPKLQSKCIEYASERKLSDIKEANKKHEIPLEIHEKVLAAGFKRRELDIKDYEAITNFFKSRMALHELSYSDEDIICHYDDPSYQEKKKLFELRIADKTRIKNEAGLRQIIFDGCSGLDEKDECFAYLPTRLKDMMDPIKERSNNV